MAQRKSPFFDTATTLGKIVAFLGISTLCGVLAAGLMLPAAAVGGAAANAGNEMLDELPFELLEEPLSVPSQIVAEDGTELATFYAENRQPVSLDEISQTMQDAMIAIEDERFYEHSGVDPRGLGRALVNNATTDSTQGASTITQQYVNNVLVNAQYLNNQRTTISGTKTVADKLREMKLAVAVEEEMSKDEILQGYLNIVLFSGRVYGVEAAAQYFYNKPASELNAPESALLAGMVQSPNGYNPVNNPEGALDRRNVVLDAMQRTGALTEDEHAAAVESPIELDITPLSSGCTSSTMGGYFCDYVQRLVLSDPAFGEDREARQRLLDRGGLTIRTTLDPELQEAAQESATEAVPADETEGVGSSLVTVEPGTGNIKAMAQNTEYSVEDEQGSTTLNFNVEQAYGGGVGFQAGSTLKPFVNMAWIESGNSMLDTVDASRDLYPQGSRFQASCKEDGEVIIPDEGGWSVNNALDDMKKPMRADYGLYWSINTSTVAQTYLQDLCDITDITTRLGIVNAGTGEPIDPQNPSFVLGAPEVAPLSMAAAYAAFAADGEYCQPRALLEVTDPRGNSYEVPPEECSQEMDSQNVAELNHVLEAIATDRIAQGALDFPIAGKTGTNNHSSSTWFIGSSTGLTTASWMGRYTSQESLQGETIGGVEYEDVWGALIAGPMWVDYMDQVGTSYPHDEFTEFEGETADPRENYRVDEAEVEDPDQQPGPEPESEDGLGDVDDAGGDELDGEGN